MTRKLTKNIATLGHLRAAGTPKTFPQFREIRNTHLDIQKLVFSIQERLPKTEHALPENFPQWIIRQKLSAIAIFTDISHAFINDPPLALTSSLKTFDMLQAEQKAFNETLSAFDMMLMKTGIDDKTTNKLNATRSKIEEILGMIERLLVTSPKILKEF